MHQHQARVRQVEALGGERIAPDVVAKGADASGHPEPTAVALGAAAAARQRAGHVGADADAQSEVADAVRDALGEDAFLAACDAGRSRPLAEILDEAYAALVAPDASPASTS